MKGLGLARLYYESFGAPMLHQEFPEWEDKIAVGLCGGGSECLGFDDEISGDHDFEPGFCLFLPEEEVLDRRTAFRLERAYARLPKEFMGFRRSLLAPVGGPRRGVIRISDFLQEKTGDSRGSLSIKDWLRVPEQSLLELTGGELFRDDSGALTLKRLELAGMPEDIRLKKLAGELLLMAQAGQYNYPRCLAHGEGGAARLALYEFVRAALHACFLLNNHYMPYYKWQFRALRELPVLAGLGPELEQLLTGELSAGAQTQTRIEELAAAFIAELQAQELTEAICGDLEKHAYSVNDRIRDGELRNLHILAAV